MKEVVDRLGPSRAAVGVRTGRRGEMYGIIGKIMATEGSRDALGGHGLAEG